MKTIVLAALSAACLSAQGPSDLKSSDLKFEVASVRPSQPQGMDRAAVGVHVDGAQVRIVSLPLRDYIARAYRVKLYQVTGPDWLSTERFDVSAKLPAGSTSDQMPEMLKALLEERFQLKLHRDKKESPVYALSAGKPPLKLQESPPDAAEVPAKGDVNLTASGGATANGGAVSVNLGNGSSYAFGNGKFEFRKVSMEMLTRQIERYVDRPVIDMTGLRGNYDLAIALTAEDAQAMMIRVAVNAGVVLPPQVLQLMDNSSISSLLDGFQQLGLKMDARKAPLDILVVDRSLKTPTEN